MQIFAPLGHNEVQNFVYQQAHIYVYSVWSKSTFAQHATVHVMKEHSLR